MRSVSLAQASRLPRSPALSPIKAPMPQDTPRPNAFAMRGSVLGGTGSIDLWFTGRPPSNICGSGKSAPGKLIALPLPSVLPQSSGNRWTRPAGVASNMSSWSQWCCIILLSFGSSVFSDSGCFSLRVPPCWLVLKGNTHFGGSKSQAKTHPYLRYHNRHEESRSPDSMCQRFPTKGKENTQHNMHTSNSKTCKSPKETKQQCQCSQTLGIWAGVSASCFWGLCRFQGSKLQKSLFVRCVLRRLCVHKQKTKTGVVKQRHTRKIRYHVLTILERGEG